VIDIVCAAVLFDCDGVLVDSAASGERSWRQWAIEYGLDPETVLDGVHGRRSTETVAMYLPPESHAQGLARIDDLEISDADGTQPIAGAGQLLAALPRDVVAVVTSASPPLLSARLAAAGLPLPDVAITSVDVTVGKPAPDGYLLAAQRLGVAIGSCLVVEDSPAGVGAARAAGAFQVLGVGDRALTTDADVVVRDLTGITWTGVAVSIPRETLLRA
jgi:sugar-phosphatase